MNVLHQSHRDRDPVFAAQVELLYRAAPEAFLVTVVNALLLTYVQRDIVASTVLITWLIYMLTVTAARTVLVWSYWHAAARAFALYWWNGLYVLGSLCAGLGWGAVGIVLYPPDAMAHQVLLAFVLGGMAAGAVAVLSSRLEAFMAFTLPAILPLTIRLLIQDDEIHVTLGVMCVVYVLALIVTARRLHHTTRSSLELRTANADLVAHLTTSKEQTEHLNDELKQEIHHRQTIEVSLQDRTQALRALASQLRKTEQRTRQRVAAQLHDELAQGLALCKLKLATLLQKHPHLASSIPFAHVQETLDEVLSATRHVMSDLRPAFMGDTRDVAAAVQWAVKKVQRHGLQVIVRDDGISPHLDEDILTVTYLAVHELLFNVLKHAHSPLASVTITCRASSLRIIVRDWGIGFLVPAMPLPRHDGGFGLFNLSEQMDSIGGHLKLVSVRQKGTLACLRIPLTAITALPVAPRHSVPVASAISLTEQAAVPGRRIRIVLADDHQMFREGLRSLLNNENDFEIVAEAEDGEQAVKMAQALNPDVLIMDVNMPAMNGVAATRQIAMEQPGTKVIGLSFQTEESMAHLMVEAGAAAYLSKVDAIGTLARTIRTLGGAHTIASDR